MDRKESIKTILLGTLSLPFMKGFNTGEASAKAQETIHFEPLNSNWHKWPDMQWAGPEFWGNRLQDWRISGGKLECNYSGTNRNLQCLTHQLSERFHDFTTSIEVELLNQTNSENDYAGIRLGIRAKNRPCPVTFTDYRRAAVYGEGLDAGINTNGRLFIGNEKTEQPLEITSPIRLQVEGRAKARAYILELTAVNPANGNRLATLRTEGIDPQELVGNVGLVAHFDGQEECNDIPSARFSDWRLSGSKVNALAGQTYGPILFAQYTLDRRIVKMTVQFTPVESIAGHKASLQIRENGRWTTLQESQIHPLARTAEFRINDWTHTENIPYRILLELPLKNRTESYTYEGTIAATSSPAPPTRPCTSATTSRAC